MIEPTINTETEPKLSSALRKLALNGPPYDINLLPDTVIDPAWESIRTEYALEIQELMALKKRYVSNSQPAQGKCKHPYNSSARSLCK